MSNTANTANTAQAITGSWLEFREDVLNLNPDLAAIIDQLDPGKNYRLYKVRYPYGSEIVRSGVFQLPDIDLDIDLEKKNNNSKDLYNNLLSINNLNLPEQVRQDLSYNARSIPVGLMLKNSIEVFIKQHDRPIPLIGHRNYTGKLFGLSSNLNYQNNFHIPTALWNVTAGARSIFMLPKISNLIEHNKVQKVFNLNATAPRALADQWDVFRELYNSDAVNNANNNWDVEIIFFAGNWFQNNTDPKWMRFINYFYRNMISLTDYFRKNQTWDAMLSLLKTDKNMFHNPYVHQKAKYILGVATGELPAFSPAIDDSFAPVSIIQNIYTNIYDLKGHAPIILQPTFFDADSNKVTSSQPVYYSLNYPVTLFSLGKQSENSVISTLNDTAHLLKKYIHLISQQQGELLIPQFDNLLHNIEFEYYHSAKNAYSFIKDIRNIANSDDRWGMKNKTIASHGPFLQGCIQISSKNV